MLMEILTNISIALADWQVRRQVARRQPPVYDHHAHKHMGARPKRSRDSNQTLSGYWEVNGMRAHCLLDSGCKG